ncbi:MAG: holo-ACP synthase [Firmicutes bacterium]|nr:holo-ACP synthase [Bacillota bacterium]
MIGIDIVEVERIRKKFSEINKQRVIDYVYTDYEKGYINTKSGDGLYRTAAGIFAAKEAVAKVLGGFGAHLQFKDIEITHGDNGAPKVSVKGENKSIEISISHEKNYAVAVALKVL